MLVLILRSAHAEDVRQIRTCVRASRRMRTSKCMRPHASRRIAAQRCWAGSVLVRAAMLLVLARTAIVRPFREERPGPGGHLDRAAGRRIGCSRAARAAAEQDRDRFFIGPGWLKEPRVRITRKGSTKMSKDTTVCAGIDTGKHKLDVAIDGGAERAQVDNNSEGHRSLLAWLRQREVERIGIEASGGYEQAVVSSLRARHAVRPAARSAFGSSGSGRSTGSRVF